jgi:hypothetical protein
MRQVHLFLLDTFCLLVSCRLCGLLTCGTSFGVFPRGGCRFGFCPLVGLMHLLSRASGHVAFFDCFVLFHDVLYSTFMTHHFWSTLRERGPLYCGLIALSS